MSELVDQIFCKIAQALARLLAMTFFDLCRIIHNAYDPNHNILKPSRTFNFHAWLQGKVELPILQRHWSDIAEAYQFLIETCALLDDETKVPSGVTIRASNSISYPRGPRMVPLCNLPSERPMYNASRPIISNQ